MFHYLCEVLKVKKKSVILSYVQISKEKIILTHDQTETTIFSDKPYSYIETNVINSNGRLELLEKVKELYPENTFEWVELYKGFKVVTLKSTKEMAIIPRLVYDRNKHINVFGHNYMYYYNDCLNHIDFIQTNEIKQSILSKILNKLSESINLNLLKEIKVDLKLNETNIATFTLNFKLQMSTLAMGYIKGNISQVYNSHEDVIHVIYSAKLFSIHKDYKNKIKFNTINTRLYIYKSNPTEFVEVLASIIQSIDKNIEVVVS